MRLILLIMSKTPGVHVRARSNKMYLKLVHVYVYVCMYVCIYIYIYTHTYIHTYIQREREREMCVLYVLYVCLNKTYLNRAAKYDFVAKHPLVTWEVIL